MQVSKRITVDGITGGGGVMTAFWRGLPGGGLIYGIRPGSFQMVWNLERVGPGTGCCQRFMMIWYLDGLCPRDLYSTKIWTIVSKIIVSGDCVRGLYLG